MRPARLIVLTVLVLSLGAFIYFFERHEPTTDQLTERKDKLYPTLTQDKAERITITNPKGTFELAKEKEAWKLLSPVTDEANAPSVTSLLSSLVNLKAERALDAADVKLEDYGLAQPPIKVTLTVTGGQDLSLELGSEMPLGNTRAALIGDGKIYLVNKYIATDLEKGLDDWRSKDLTQVYASDVASLTVSDAAGRVALAHSGSIWTLTEPIADLANREHAESLVTDVDGAQIKEFVDHPGNLAELGLDPPAVEVTIVRRDDKPPIQLAFGAQREVSGNSQRACRRGERVYWVDASAASRASSDLTQWRSAELVRLDTWSADTLEIEAGGEKASLERKDGIWKAGDAEVAYEGVSDRLSSLAGIKVLAFDLPKPTGEPSGHVKVTVADGAVVEATFYPGGTDGQAIAVVPGRPGAMAVAATQVAEVLAAPAKLAEPKPTPTPEPTETPEAGGDKTETP